MNNKADALFLSLFRSSVLRLFSAYLKTHRYYILSFISCIYFALHMLFKVYLLNVYIIVFEGIFTEISQASSY